MNFPIRNFLLRKNLKWRNAQSAFELQGLGNATGCNYTDYNGDDQTDEDNGFVNSYTLIASMGNKLVKTGRQSKKGAARTKGGEFQARRRKKRIYFCCVSSEFDVLKLHDELT